MNKYAVIDLETSGHSPDSGDKIIEIGLVIIENNGITEQFSTMINPRMTIPAFITSLTGIRDEDVADAPFFSDIAETLMALIQDCQLVAHNADFDIGFLNAAFDHEAMPQLNNTVIDTVELARILYPTAPSFKLSQLAAYHNIEHADPHRALSDAHVTGMLLLKMIDKIDQLPYETIAHLHSLQTNLKSDIAHLLESSQNNKDMMMDTPEHLEIFRGMAFRKAPEDEQDKSEDMLSFGQLMDSVYEAGGYLARQLERYEKRPGQRVMSETVFDAFSSHQHALIEAETGTGKTLAYLIPAIYEACKTSERVVISTYTTQLQTQLLDEEIPLVQSLLPFEFKAALLKGKRHYISLQRFTKELYDQEYDHYGITLTKAMLLVWLTETLTGDIDEVTLPSSGYAFYYKVSAENEEYSRSDAEWLSKSHYQKARKQAQKAHVVITNHALICTDLFNESKFIPAYDKAIIDEAHHLEDTVSRHYGLKLDYQNMQYHLNQLGSAEQHSWIARFISSVDSKNQRVSNDQWDRTFNFAKKEIDDFCTQLFQYVKMKHSKTYAISDVGRIQYRFDNDLEDSGAWSVIVDMAARLTYYIRDLIHMLTVLKTDLKDMPAREEIEEEADQHISTLQAMIDQIEQLFLLEDKSETVKWIEMDASESKNTVFIYSEPLDVSRILYDEFFQEKKSIILTSATLTMNGSFSFMTDRLGLPDDVIAKQIKSPFHYEDQVQLMVPNDFPDIKKDSMDTFIDALADAIVSLADVTSGRMLVLFTSYDMLKRTHAKLRETIDAADFVLFAQGITSGSRSRLKKNFQMFDRSILLGTSSFWEGIDIPGEDLSSLVIVRLPFQPPGQPVYEARAQALKAQGQNPFMKLSLPQAVIRFKQGFGRLIRSTQDRGIVMVCDTRIVKSKYGHFFTQSIPDVPVVRDCVHNLIEQAGHWFK